jgi:rhodanese-related sulfurtransferase
MLITKAKILFLLFALFLFCITKTQGQNNRMVKSKSYHVLLKKLLKHDVPEISVESLSKIKHSVLLLDARELEEFNVSHLRNAKFVGYKNFDIYSLNDANKDQQIVVYCSVGYRSEQITEKLIGAGFTNVQNLYGGIFEWKNKKLDVVDVNGVTNNVHPYSKTWGLWLKNADKVYKTP